MPSRKTVGFFAAYGLTPLAAALLLAAGCADLDGSGDGLREEPLPGQEDLDPGKADGASSALWTYYTVVREDTRSCASPACGGLWVKRVNQPDTKCADGSWQTECYVASIDWSRAGFSEEDAAGAELAARELRAMLRGKLVLRDQGGAAAALFQASESWESGVSGVAEGNALRTHPATCATAPCAGVTGTRLNKGGQSTATYTSLSGPGLDGAALAAMASEDGLVLVGQASGGGTTRTFEAERSWVRRGHSEAESDRTDAPTCSASALSTFPKDELRVHIIDVGQGDAIWVQTPWKSSRSESLNVLIDAGPSGVMPGSSPGGDVIVSYMLAAGLEEGDVLDGVVVTHAHDDHFGGLPRVAETFGVARYTDPGFSAGSQAFLDARKVARELAEDHGGHVHVPAVGELVPRLYTNSDLFGPRVDTTLLWAAEAPPDGNTANPTGPDVNNTSIALALRFGGRQVLLMGDIEDPVEAALVEAHDAGEIDLASAVLKVAHHGSSRATSTEFLSRAFPQKAAHTWAVISSGRRTFTGSYLPTDATLERLALALPKGHVLSTENRDQHKVVGTEHGDDTVLIRVKASGAVSACYVP